MEGIEWWGYLHVNGSIRVKRYFNDIDLIEAADSPFCKKVVGPFFALDRCEAVHTVMLNKKEKHSE